MNALRAFFFALTTWVAILGLVWLVPAGLLPTGTWAWQRGLWAVGAISLLQAVGAAFFTAQRPSSDRVGEQSRGPVNDTKSSGWRDPLVDGLGMVYGAALFIFIPIDVFYLHLLPPPSATVSTAAAIASLIGVVLMLAAVAQHFVTADARESLGRRVIDTGLYGTVRHPMYLGALLWLSGALLWLSGAAMWLESVAALIACLGVFAFILIRIAIEEAHLRKTVPEYVEYTRRVRSRLLPFVL